MQSDASLTFVIIRHMICRHMICRETSSGEVFTVGELHSLETDSDECTWIRVCNSLRRPTAKKGSSFANNILHWQHCTHKFFSWVSDGSCAVSGEYMPQGSRLTRLWARRRSSTCLSKRWWRPFLSWRLISFRLCSFGITKVWTSLCSSRRPERGPVLCGRRRLRFLELQRCWTLSTCSCA